MIKKAALCALLYLVAGSLSVMAQNKPFSVTSKVVLVDVLVTVDGKPVDDLNASDFEIYDNGIRQEIEYAKLQRDTPLVAILIFDMSTSVVDQRLDNLKNAARALFGDFRSRDQAALITFNNAVILGSPVTGNLKQIETALDRTQPSGNSSLVDASYAGLVLAESGEELPLVIIFSDGRDTSSWLTGSDVLETAKRSDAVVYAVSTQLGTDASFLSDLTELTGGALFEVEHTWDLAKKFLEILKEFRKRYVISYVPQEVSEEGWHKLEVRVPNRPAEIRTRSGYIPDAPTP